MKSKKLKTETKSAVDYIAGKPQPFRDMLEELKTLIKSVIPDAEESISYQVLCFKYLYMLVGIGANKNYCSFYVMSPALVKKMKKDLKDLKVSGSTLHFSPGEPLPKTLIKKIIKARVKENKERVKRISQRVKK